MSHVRPASAIGSSFLSALAVVCAACHSSAYANGELGIGLGIPATGGCALLRETVGGVSTTIAAPVDAGEFCAKVYDAGRTSGIVDFSATITHP